MPVRSVRKVSRGELAPGCPAHAGPDGVWRVQDHAAARAVLRSGDTRQAGFGIENTAQMNGKMRMPVLYRDGPEHREHRRQTAKFFTPRRVDIAYRALMERLADQQCATLRARGEADLTTLSFRLAVAVAAEVIGLSAGRGGLARRLDRFFHNADPGSIRQRLLGGYAVGAFYWWDVRPAVRTRRRQRRDDLISHLIDEGCTKPEILGECVTFAAAGMVTTREFITLAAWHLLTDDALRLTYLDGDEADRHRVLHEILRLEPVVANLARTTTADLALDGVTIPAGSLVDIGVAAANLDPAAVGDDPAALCPDRAMPAAAGDAGLSFGDGPHRCPGAYIAIQETDIFLTRLLAVPGLRMTREPTVRIRPDIASYELTGLRLSAG